MKAFSGFSPVEMAFAKSYFDVAPEVLDIIVLSEGIAFQVLSVSERQADLALSVKRVSTRRAEDMPTPQEYAGGYRYRNSVTGTLDGVPLAGVRHFSRGPSVVSDGPTALEALGAAPVGAVYVVDYSGFQGHEDRSVTFEKVEGPYGSFWVQMSSDD